MHGPRVRSLSGSRVRSLNCRRMSCRRFSGPLPQLQTNVMQAVLGSAPSIADECHAGGSRVRSLNGRRMSCRRFSGPLPQVQTNVMQAVLGSAPSSADYDVMQAVLGSAPSVSAHARSRCIGPQPHWRALGIEVGTALNEGAARPHLEGASLHHPLSLSRASCPSRARRLDIQSARTRWIRFRAAGGLGRRVRLCFAREHCSCSPKNQGTFRQFHFVSEFTETASRAFGSHFQCRDAIGASWPATDGCDDDKPRPCAPTRRRLWHQRSVHGTAIGQHLY
jgi:hypothetical protein